MLHHRPNLAEDNCRDGGEWDVQWSTEDDVTGISCRSDWSPQRRIISSPAATITLDIKAIQTLDRLKAIIIAFSCWNLSQQVGDVDVFMKIL